MLKKLKNWWIEYKYTRYLKYLAYRCPNFWGEYPKEDTEGPWVGITYTIYFGYKIQDRVLYKNLSLYKVYPKVRELGYKLEDKHPTYSRSYHYEGHYGIAWQIKRPDNTDNYYTEIHK